MNSIQSKGLLLFFFCQRIFLKALELKFIKNVNTITFTSHMKSLAHSNFWKMSNILLIAIEHTILKFTIFLQVIHETNVLYKQVIQEILSERGRRSIRINV